jgi:hypothetical protein
MINDITGKRKKYVYIILGIMIAVQLGVIIYYFQFCKQGYHSDEIWSYGYANSFYEKDIYVDSEGNYTYMNEWTDTQVLKDYIVVNDGEQFRYDSVYHNQILDLSPPFHSMVLHTICSFFPGKFSRWYSFSINIVSFIVCMIFLFMTARLFKDDIFALCCCGLYGFTLGARDTYVYLRMYAMCSAMVMIIIYNLVRYLKRIQEEDKLFNRNLTAICIVSFLGFMTHYYMVSFMGILTFLICLYLLFSKKIKAMFVYGFSLLATFLLSVAAFPSMFQNTVGNQESVNSYMNYNFKIRFRLLSNFIMKKLFNITVSVFDSGYVRIGAGVLVFIIIMMIPVVFLFRDTRLVRGAIKRLLFCIRHPKHVIVCILKKINWLWVVFLAAIVCQMIVVSETSNLYGMGSCEDRYLFFLFPLVIIVNFSVISYIGKLILCKFSFSNAILIVSTLCFISVNIYNCTCYGDYLFRRYSDVSIEDCVEGRDCMFIRNLPWMLTTMVPSLSAADEFIQVDKEDYADLEAAYKERSGEGQIVAIVDTSFLKSGLNTLNSGDYNLESTDGLEDTVFLENERLYNEDLEPDTDMELLTTQYVFSRTMEVYLINP